eukprot:SM000043S15798  [mRNA]  locus=s43:232850:238627:+ [translate_table: standard]
MQPTPESVQALSRCLLQTLAAEPEPRRSAEAYLKQAADQVRSSLAAGLSGLNSTRTPRRPVALFPATALRDEAWRHGVAADGIPSPFDIVASLQPGYGITVLSLLTTEGVSDQVRQAAAVNFKNHVKYRWAVEHLEPGAPGTPGQILEVEKEQIKALILPLMLNTPTILQAQISEALSIISQHDFPSKWSSLLPELTSKLSSEDYHVIVGVLRTANSIFKRFRDQYKTNELLLELKYVLDIFVQPLLELFKRTGQLISSTQSDLPALKPLLESARLICRIFYSLNFVDLPEVFQDHLQEWMTQFQGLLRYENPLLRESDPDKEDLINSLKASICENVNLYVEKYEEEFQEFLPIFANDIWTLLLSLGLSAGQDRIATTSINFLITVARSVHHPLFSDPARLQMICQSIVIPNLQFRDEDEELFDMNYIEYIRRDIEGSDSDTRRRAACELIKALAVHYEQQVTQLFSMYVAEELGKYAQNPMQNWKEKDCAIYLVVALAVKQKTIAQGAVATNNLVNIGDFFQLQIFPELQAQDVNNQPVLKADALKFLTTFRSQIATVNLLPNLIGFLTAESNVVHSYAANCIERMLVLKDHGRSRVTPQNLTPYVEPLLRNLFAILQMPDSQENQYAMKCIMRVISVADVKPFATQCLSQLTEILAAVCKNPTQPNFNHYLFEAVAALVTRACASDASQTATSEGLLFPIFQMVLQEDIVEFAPYVFQILALLIEIRSPPLPQGYMAIFPPLLTPLLWQRSANVPALVRLLQAYLQKAGQDIVAGRQLESVLGIFQKLNASKHTDQHGFFILNTVVENLEPSQFAPYVGQIWKLLFSRLQGPSRTSKFVKALLVFMSLFTVKHGVDVVSQSIDSVQQGLFRNILESIWMPNLPSVIGDLETKLCTVAATKVLCEYKPLVGDENFPLWGKLLDNTLTLLERPEEERAEDEGDVPDLDEVAGYTATYARLHSAGKREEDPTPDVHDAKQYLTMSLSQLSSRLPGKLSLVIQQSLQASNQAALSQYFGHYKVAFN